MNTQRRGVALLLVLSTLVIVVPALALLAIRATSLHRSTHQTRLVTTIDSSLSSFESSIETWLAENASAVVLPLDATSPRLTIDQWNWTAGSQQVSVSITAFDLQGMLPVTTARNTPVGHRLAPEIAATLRRVPSDHAANLGLDGWSKRSVYKGQHSWYPNQYHDTHREVNPGEVVAFDLGELDLPNVLNVNTAPWVMVESVARFTGTTNLDRLADARNNGDTAATLPRPASQSQGSIPKIRLSTTSDAWAFRIDAASGSARRSWWLVYVHGQDGWRLHRRVPIDA